MYCTDRSELGKNINTDEAAALGMCVYIISYTYVRICDSSIRTCVIVLSQVYTYVQTYVKLMVRT